MNDKFIRLESVQRALRSSLSIGVFRKLAAISSEHGSMRTRSIEASTYQLPASVAEMPFWFVTKGKHQIYDSKGKRLPESWTGFCCDGSDSHRVWFFGATESGERSFTPLSNPLAFWVLAEEIKVFVEVDAQGKRLKHYFVRWRAENVDVGDDFDVFVTLLADDGYTLDIPRHSIPLFEPARGFRKSENSWLVPCELRAIFLEK